MSKELVEFIARSLADKPDEVKVKEEQDDKGSILELSVAETDLGKVIGKRGKTAKAIRSVISVYSTISRKSTLLKIME